MRWHRSLSAVGALAFAGVGASALSGGAALAESATPEKMAEMGKRLNRLLAQPSTYRSRAEVTSFFDGLELVEPGVTPIQQWRPDTSEEASAVAAI